MTTELINALKKKYSKNKLASLVSLACANHIRRNENADPISSTPGQKYEYQQELYKAIQEEQEKPEEKRDQDYLTVLHSDYNAINNNSFTGNVK